ncbi:hypothetical protein BDD43_2832 [Mucilaginibacter gracilis]|uniref:Uncharacterized protein n=1 Tax=Mucilaginibacter gracilis TaxID=423350 RepID=A0A495J124_9SPHI|nr:hypothetical protein [Mucilaginibacter gracilis]RKR82647.1 hypothetical protein BDD43_2832 [Mucilaginibacter gracilis]
MTKLKSYLSVFVNISAIVIICFNIKVFSFEAIIQNPSTTILFYTLLITVLIYLIPYIFNKLTIKSEKYMVSGMVIIISLFICFILHSFTSIKNTKVAATKTNIRLKDTLQIINLPSKKRFNHQTLKKKNVNISIKKKHNSVDSTKTQSVSTTNQKGNNEVNQNNGTNNGNIGGKNNFNGGTGNTYGNVTVGDSYFYTVTTDRKLSEKSLNVLYNLLQKISKTNNTEPNAVNILTEQYCNAPLIPAQISEYLREKGYQLGGGIRMANYNQPITKGIKLEPMQKDAINIVIGEFQ